MEGPKFDYDHLEYDTPERLYSFGYQLQEIFDHHRRLDGIKILNIGKGGGFLKQYLKPHLGTGGRFYDVDVYGPLGPDVYSDVRHLAFGANSVEVVLCCQVLQYVPYSEFPMALREIHRVIKPGGRAIISMPDDLGYAYFRIRMPKLSLLKSFSFPFIRRAVTLQSQKNYPGYWEINRKGYDLAGIRRSISKSFRLRRDYRLPKHPYHHFFVLEKEDDG